MTAEESWKRLIFRWTAPKGFVAMALFFVLTLISEYVMVYLFTSLGMKDKFLINFFSVTISPLFHLVPLGVIIVLASSWVYLTRYIAVIPRRVLPPKKPPEVQRRRPPKARFKPFRKFFERISRAFSRIRGVSYVQRRLSFARATIKSAATVLLVFLISILVLFVLIRPRGTYDLAAGLYATNTAFQGFVLKTIEIGKGVAQVLSPIGWLASSIDETLRAAAPSFRNTLEGIGASTTAPLARIDLAGGYLLCQNLAAWISAVLVLAYGEYASRRYRIRKP